MWKRESQWEKLLFAGAHVVMP